VDGRLDLQEEVQNAEELKARQYGRWECQETGLEVLSAEDGVLPHWRVSALVEIPPNAAVLVVPVPQADKGPLPQEVPKMEGGAEGVMAEGRRGDGEREGAVESSRTLRGRWVVLPDDTGLPVLDRCWKDSATCGGGRRWGQRGVGGEAPGGSGGGAPVGSGARRGEVGGGAWG